MSQSGVEIVEDDFREVIGGFAFPLKKYKFLESYNCRNMLWKYV